MRSKVHMMQMSIVHLANVLFGGKLSKKSFFQKKNVFPKNISEKILTKNDYRSFIIFSKHKLHQTKDKKVFMP
jgi:hypothetical protein